MTHDTERTDPAATETPGPVPGAHRGTPAPRAAYGDGPVPPTAEPEPRRVAAPGATTGSGAPERGPDGVPGTDGDGRGLPLGPAEAAPPDGPEATPARTTAPGRHTAVDAPSPDGLHDKDAPGDRPLIPAHERDALILRMRQAVSDFVEDPRQAVEEADSAFDRIVADLAEALDERRRALRASWQGADCEARTEELRVALRNYRDAGERLLRV
ncbi:hypothetical protein [Streptomyces sp. NRRL WC-3549]|uniref:hypothetical protein n=1 Tax=Streptomyces sp. NRRL WC-3549 TaxID=1463925 RepID=UPI0004C91E3A|nr:hypothetical protein [Streptomyces sp. NRRL WC-3549]